MVDAPRGAVLLKSIHTFLGSAKSPIADPRPMSPSELRACEDAAHAALPPSLAFLLQVDRNWLARHTDAFAADGSFAARGSFEVIAEHLGNDELAEAYREICATRFPGRAIALDSGSDSARILYFGNADSHGEYPVLGIDYDDVPELSVAAPGFDVWLAVELKVAKAKTYVADATATSKRLLGGASAWSPASAIKLKKPVLAPKPGAIKHLAPPPLPQKKLTGKLLASALDEAAIAGDDRRVSELLALAKEQRAGAGVLDGLLAALVCHGETEAVARALEAGANPNAKTPHGYAEPPVLIDAISRGHTAIVELLLRKGANPNAERPRHEMALHVAIRAEPGDPKMVELLCKHGASPDGSKANPLRPLFDALDPARTQFVAPLLAAGADARSVTRFANGAASTPLRSAFLSRVHGEVPALLRAGATRDDDLMDVYNAEGDDIRALSVAYAPSKAPQKIVFEITVHAEGKHFIKNLKGAPFNAAEWKPTVRVISPISLSGVKVGLNKRKLVVEATSLPEKELRKICRKLFFGTFEPGPQAPTGLIVTALTVRGEAQAPLLEGAAARAFVNQP